MMATAVTNEVDANKTTMEKVQSIANGIHPSIYVTIDYPSNHPNNRLPVLDLQLWIEEKSTVDQPSRRYVMHTHYMKDISSKHVINKSSAIPTNTKLNILTADLVRIQRNISRLCDQTERTKHIQHLRNS